MNSCQKMNTQQNLIDVINTIKDDYSGQFCGQMECENSSEIDNRPLSPPATRPSPTNPTKKSGKIGRMTQVKEDGEVKHVEKIFRIVKERSVEYDSDDEEAKAERESDKTVRRHD